MADRGPDQDLMPVGGASRLDRLGDPTYKDASYLGDSPDDDEEVHDLGFIVDDHDDRRITLTGGWQRLDALDEDEGLETNPTGALPHATSLRERGAPGDWFATDYHVQNAKAEAQEEDFVQTSMLSMDPDGNDGEGDPLTDSIAGIHGEPQRTDLVGHVPGVALGLGTTLSMDAGSQGFEIRDNPLMQPVGREVSAGLIGDQLDGAGEGDEAGVDAALEALADRYVREAEENAEQEERERRRG